MFRELRNRRNVAMLLVLSTDLGRRDFDVSKLPSVTIRTPFDFEDTNYWRK
jgi:hypothetical protein